MNEIEYINIRIKTELPDDEIETLESSSNVKNTHIEQGNLEALEVPVNCFHSIFSADSDDWGSANVKTEPGLDTADTHSTSWNDFGLEDKTSINNLKTKHEKLSLGYRIEPSIDDSKEPDEVDKDSIDSKAKDDLVVFDKSLARYRLKCPKCYFLTDNRGNLKQHMKIHERPLYKCEFCKFVTKHRNSIKSHVLRHEIKKGKRGRKRTRK